MFEKMDVNGDKAHPLYNGLRGGTDAVDIQWNFAKFLIKGDGTIVKRYGHKEEPNSFLPDIEKLLV